MSAETLRRAAALMRERAEAATPGPWVRYGDHLVWPSEKGPAANDPILTIGEAHEDSATHIVSWHPAIAVAVADGLSMQADHALGRGAVCGSCVEQALSVANAYLGEVSQ